MRALTGDQLAALRARTVKRRFFVWCDALDDAGAPDPAGFWDDVGSVDLDGRTYHGSGNLIGIGDLAAQSDLSVPGLQIVISAIETESLSVVRGRMLAQRPITVSLGVYDTVERVLIPPLIPWFVGVIDAVEIKTPPTGERSQIVLTCESISRALTIRRTDTRSPASCMERSATDRFYDYTASQRERTIYFGRADPTARRRKPTVGREK